jgi:hypothetical protein
VSDDLSRPTAAHLEPVASRVLAERAETNQADQAETDRAETDRAEPDQAEMDQAESDAVRSRGVEHEDVHRSARAGVLPHPSEQRLPGNPLSSDSYSPGALPMPRWVGVLAGVCAILLVPWIIYLAVELPEQARSAHYDVVWVGFDMAMFVALAGLGWCAWRRSTYTEVMAAITATLLVTDAWFDVVSADTDMRRMEAFGSALLIELPLAALCAWVAQNAERLRRRAYRQLWRLARVEGLLGEVKPEHRPTGEVKPERRPT